VASHNIDKIEATWSWFDLSTLISFPGAVLPAGAVTPLPPVPAPFTEPALLNEAVVDWGKDISTFPDMDAALMLSTDLRVVVTQKLLRRFSTPRGSLAFHQDYGYDLRQFVNDTITDETLFRMKAGSEREAEQEEYVSEATAQVRYDVPTETIYLSMEVVISTGPFRFVLAVDQLRVTLVTEEEA
jgi:hypothetical protein